MGNNKQPLNKALRNEVLSIFDTLYPDADIEREKENISLTIIDFIIAKYLMMDVYLTENFDDKVRAYMKRKDENTRLALLKGLLTDGYIDVDYERIRMRFLPYLKNTKGDDLGPDIIENPNNKQFRTIIKTSADRKTITLLPNNLIVEATSHAGDKFNIFYVPEYLIKNNNLVNIPKGLYMVPYEYFDDCAVPKRRGSELMIMRKSENQACVIIMHASEFLRWEEEGNNQTNLEHMKELILEQSPYKPEVYLDEFGLKYQITVTGKTIQDVISEAQTFDSTIKDNIYKLLDSRKIESTC